MKCQCGYDPKGEKESVCRLCGAPLQQAAAPKGTPRPERASGRPSGRRHVLISPGSAPQILESEKPFSLGRSPESDLTIPSKRVSRSHAVVFWRSGLPVIKNLSEQNPTLVNDRRIEEHELRDRDEIKIGPYTCRYRLVLGDASAAREHPDSNSETQAEGGAAMEGQLEDLSAAELLRTFEAQRKTGTLELRRGNEEGRLLLEDGRCTSATVGGDRGQKAFFTLAGWAEGSFAFRVGEVSKPPPLKIIRKFDYSGGDKTSRERELKKTPISKLLEMAERRRGSS